MGLCRVLVYVTAALAVAGRVGPAVAGGAAVLLCQSVSTADRALEPVSGTVYRR